MAVLMSKYKLEKKFMWQICNKYGIQKYIIDFETESDFLFVT